MSEELVGNADGIREFDVGGECSSEIQPHATTSPAMAVAGFRLPLDLKQMGEEENCRHRSGWPYVMSFLRGRCQDRGILLDDFIERSFQHAYARQEWHQPWVGIFHHPPGLPTWLDPTAAIEAIVETEAFRRSRETLKGAVVLSNELGDWIEHALDIPVLVLRHPTEIPARKFSLDAFLEAPRPKVVQVGWYARNTRAIYQLDVPTRYQKVHLLQRRPWVMKAIDLVDAHSPHRDRPWHSDVQIMEELKNDQYDDLLSCSILFNEYYAVSASNTIVEAIARGTPLIVNRLRSNEEYLGKGYPLFFDSLDDATAILNDRGRIVAGADWLAGMDKGWLDGANFAERVTQFVVRCAD